MLLFPLLYAAASAVAVLGDVYDVTKTIAGIKKGVAVEDFTFIVGQKCTSAAKYFLRDLIVMSPCFALPFVFLALHNAPVAYGSLVALVAAGLKHYQGGAEWITLLNGGKVPALQTAWQKFIGWF
jgi:hypothetical protein